MKCYDSAQGPIYFQILWLRLLLVHQLKVFDLLSSDTRIYVILWSGTPITSRNGMKEAGFDIIDGDSAIVPVMLYDAKLSQVMADKLSRKGNLCYRILLSGGT